MRTCSPNCGAWTIPLDPFQMRPNRGYIGLIYIPSLLAMSGAERPPFMPRFTTPGMCPQWTSGRNPLCIIIVHTLLPHLAPVLTFIFTTHHPVLFYFKISFISYLRCAHKKPLDIDNLVRSQATGKAFELEKLGLSLSKRVPPELQVELVAWSDITGQLTSRVLLFVNSLRLSSLESEPFHNTAFVHL